MTTLLLFMGFVVGGVFVEIAVLRLYLLLAHARPSSRFLLIKYGYLLTLPLLGVLVVSQQQGTVTAYIFLVSSIFGTLLELLVGFSYRHIVGERLWTYHRYTVTKYTSVLSLPLWGLAGVLLWLVVQVFDYSTLR